MIENTEEAQEAVTTLCHAISPIVFHQYVPAFSPSALLRGEEWLTLPARADTNHAAPLLTETAAPDPAAPADVRSSKRNSNRARPTDGQTASLSPPADQDSDVTSVASTGESDRDSDYVELTEKSPMSQANTPDLAGHTSELEEMHKVADSKLVKIAQPTMLFSHIDELKLPELNDAKTDPTENLQDNGATPPVLTQPSPPHLPLEDASVDPTAPPPSPCVQARCAKLQAREGDLPDVCPLGADYMLYGAYQDWVQQNPREHLDG